MLVVAVLPRPPPQCARHGAADRAVCVAAPVPSRSDGSPDAPADPPASLAGMEAFCHRVHFFSCTLADIVGQDGGMAGPAAHASRVGSKSSTAREAPRSVHPPSTSRAPGITHPRPWNASSKP